MPVQSLVEGFRQRTAAKKPDDEVVDIPPTVVGLCAYPAMTTNINTVAMKAIIPALENDDRGSLSSPLIPTHITSVKNKKVAIKAGLISRVPRAAKKAGKCSPALRKMVTIE